MAPFPNPGARRVSLDNTLNGACCLIAFCNGNVPSSIGVYSAVESASTIDVISPHCLCSIAFASGHHQLLLSI